MEKPYSRDRWRFEGKIHRRMYDIVQGIARRAGIIAGGLELPGIYFRAHAQRRAGGGRVTRRARVPARGGNAAVEGRECLALQQL
jgi:hypothetical protein